MVILERGFTPNWSVMEIAAGSLAPGQQSPAWVWSYVEPLSFRIAMTNSTAETTTKMFLRSWVLNKYESKNKTKAAAIKPQNSFDFLLESRLISKPPSRGQDPGFSSP